MPAILPQNETFISRKITINLDQHQLNVRPVIKGAINEAANTLVDAFSSFDKNRTNELFLMNLFKNMINTASIQSRDFAIQVEGCKGILVWSDERSQPLFSSWSQQTINLSKYAKLLGNWTVKPFLKTGDKLRRKLMANYPHHLIIGFIGVLSQEQDKGLGSALVNYVIEKADSSNYPIYVEAIDQHSIKFFEKFGFVVQGQCNVSKDQTITPMIRFPMVTKQAMTLQLRPGRKSSDKSN